MTPRGWLRTSYWAGAVADAAVGISILIPSRVGEMEFRYPMGIAATLMFGWTILLLWADRRPSERKGVLPITVVVILGLLVSGTAAVVQGLISFEQAVPSVLLGVSLIALMSWSYVNDRRAD